MVVVDVVVEVRPDKEGAVPSCWVDADVDGLLSVAVERGGGTDTGVLDKDKDNDEEDGVSVPDAEILDDEDISRVDVVGRASVVWTTTRVESE